jgi:lysophospholipase L1-like esterase
VQNSQSSLSNTQRLADNHAVNKRFFNRITVHNKGIGGQNSREGLARFSDAVLAMRPHIVLIYFGLNDTLNEPKFIEADEYIDNLQKMIASAAEQGITPVLTTIHHIDVNALLTRHEKSAYGEEGPKRKIDRYNSLIHQLSDKLQLRLLDWCHIMDQAMETSNKTNENTTYRLPDGVHLTVDGNQLLAHSFYNLITPDLRDGQTIVCFGDSITFGVHTEGAGTETGKTYPAYLLRLISQ